MSKSKCFNFNKNLKKLEKNKIEHKLSCFEQIISYEFNDKKLLNQALTHSSYCRENELKSIDSNERLEFLGDAYLDAIAGMEIYNRLKGCGEGVLTKIRASVVCEESLEIIGKNLKIGSFLNMGRGEELNGGRHRASIIADSIESVIGAMVLDGGYDVAREFVIREFHQIIEDALSGKLNKDYKTQVQEILQKDGTAPDIRYILDDEKGPDHKKIFFVHLSCNGKRMGSGSGKTKKEAEQNAAKETLDGGYI